MADIQNKVDRRSVICIIEPIVVGVLSTYRSGKCVNWYEVRNTVSLAVVDIAEIVSLLRDRSR